MTQVEEVHTGQGIARLHLDLARRSRAVLVLGHGAGGGIDAADLAAIATQLPSSGISVVRVEQPWRVAGRRIAVAPPLLDEAWRETAQRWPRGPLVVGGRSAGARVACRTARGVGARGVVCLAYPLHPPGRAGRSRADELGTGLPTLVVQGDRDVFGGPRELPALPGLTVAPVAGADHAFAVPARGPLTRGEALELLVRAATSFVVDVVG